jgi:hypothetical protein
MYPVIQLKNNISINTILESKGKDAKLFSSGMTGITAFFEI